ncbi:MAG TPA: RNA-dependent DNA polymerase [Mesotoga infera]|uniref:RNA-dependent DNA polymerase n=1 Tax=Mesotoga infera TaxID=1236046 RepID=A0A7C1CWL4_9BACT|nr:RNA-dependent DNA polymerase [Mesotoga infera]
MEVYVKRANNIYEKVYSFENIYLAYIKARKNKRYREDVLEFTDNLEANLITIQNELIWKMYSPGRYREFVVCEPKRRIIQAPSFKDRVVQHALCNVIEPVFDLRFICDSYACRKGKGTHAGVERTIYFLRKLAGSSSRTYCLKADISSYFPSIDHTVLKTLLRKRVSCEATLWLIDTIIDSSSCGCTRGIPIGALTSQLFANIYLNELDTFVKHDLRAKHYVRYVDDFIILDHSKQRLREYLSEIKGYLEDRLRLALNHKTGIFPVSRGIDFLGYRIWADKLLLRRANIRRSKRRLRKLRVLYEDGAVKLEKLRSSVASWQGQCKFSKSYSAMQRVIDFAGLSEVFR